MTKKEFIVKLSQSSSWREVGLSIAEVINLINEPDMAYEELKSENKKLAETNRKLRQELKELKKK